MNFCKMLPRYSIPRVWIERILSELRLTWERTMVHALSGNFYTEDCIDLSSTMTTVLMWPPTESYKGRSPPTTLGYHLPTYTPLSFTALITRSPPETPNTLQTSPSIHTQQTSPAFPNRLFHSSTSPPPKPHLPLAPTQNPQNGLCLLQRQTSGLRRPPTPPPSFQAGHQIRGRRVHTHVQPIPGKCQHDHVFLDARVTQG
jgi:hypothetical protein